MLDSVIIVSQPYSGGQYLYSALTQLLDIPISHTHPAVTPLAQFESPCRLHPIIALRDIRDSMVSQWLLEGDIRLGAPKIEEGEDIIELWNSRGAQHILECHREISALHNRYKEILTFFYEDFINDVNYIKNRLESAWNIKIDEGVAREAQNQLNSLHSEKIETIGWKEVIADPLHGLFSNMCGLPDKTLLGEEYFVSIDSNKVCISHLTWDQTAPAWMSPRKRLRYELSGLTPHHGRPEVPQAASTQHETVISQLSSGVEVKKVRKKKWWEFWK